MRKSVTRLGLTVPAAMAILGAAGAATARPTSSNGASQLSDKLWAQKTIYTPPEPIDTSAQAEAKRQRKQAKRAYVASTTPDQRRFTKTINKAQRHHFH